MGLELGQENRPGPKVTALSLSNTTEFIAEVDTFKISFCFALKKVKSKAAPVLDQALRHEGVEWLYRPTFS
jgi:hypothetical protein